MEAYELNTPVTFDDPYNTYDKTIKKAKQILVPLDGNGEETAQALVCYDFKKLKHEGKKGKGEEIGEKVWVSNPLYDGFDADGQYVEVKKIKRVCVPFDPAASKY